jgi:VCBS repeat-containing protein
MPNPNFNGIDSFTYKANDGSADSPTAATVTITVTPVNDPPVAAGDAYSTLEDIALTVLAPGVLGNDNDVDGDTLTAVLVSGPAHGSLTLNANGSFIYTPSPNFNGSDAFTYKANDGSADSNVATVSLTVTPVNDPPVANDDTASTAYQTPVTIDVLANDTDVDGDALTAILASGPANGSASCGSVCTYTPNTGFAGSDSFTYQASDGRRLSNVATVTVTVGGAPNLPPVASDDAYGTTQGTTLNVAAPGVLSNDSDPEAGTLTAVPVGGPASGNLTLSPDGSFSYAPDPAFTGFVTFTYQVSDGSLLSNVATVTITVSPTGGGGAQLYLSLKNATGTLNGLGPNGSSLPYANEDILSWNGTNYTMVFDGSAAGLSGDLNIAAFDIDVLNNRVLMAFGGNAWVPGVGSVTASDAVVYELASRTFRLLFDGSDVGLTTRGEALDALQLLPDGRLVVSTAGNALVPSAGITIAARDQDLLTFTPTSLGATTKGSWRFYFDGSDVGLTTWGEGVDAASVAANGDVYLSTRGNFAVAGVSGQNEDVFRCAPSQLGNFTACTFAPFFDGTAHGLRADDVDGIDLP